jgi:hypothetical protein
MRVVLAFGLLAPLAAANVFLMCAQSAYIDGLGLANVYSGTVNTQSLCEVSRVFGQERQSDVGKLCVTDLARSKHVHSLLPTPSTAPANATAPTMLRPTFPTPPIRHIPMA